MPRKIGAALLVALLVGTIGYLSVWAALAATGTAQYIPSEYFILAGCLIGFYGLILTLDIAFNW